MKSRFLSVSISIASVLPETHPLIETVTAPLADNAERRLAAQVFLEDNFDSGHPGMADATARLEVAKRVKLWNLTKTTLWILAGLAIAVTIFSNASTMRFMGMVCNFDIFESWEKNKLPAGLTKEERLLLGDPERDDFDQKKELHLLAPENPAYFFDYAHASVSKWRSYPEMDPLPPDFLGTASRIAPENAFFLYYAAGTVGKESVTGKKSSAPNPPTRYQDGVRLSPLPGETEYDITDPVAFEEALQLITQAVELPDFETHTNQLIAKRTRLLPDDTLADFISSQYQVYDTSSGLIQLRYVSDLLCARAEQLSKSGNKEEFVDLAGQREAFISHLSGNPDRMLVGELVYALIAAGTASNFEAAADRLGLAEMAETYRKQSEALVSDRDQRVIRAAKEEEPFSDESLSTFSLMFLPMVTNQVTQRKPIREADFEPLRMAEHELLAGAGVLAVALLIPIGALLVFFFRFAATPMIRFPAQRMSGVLGIADWLWVTGLGIVLPILLFLAITRLTPLSGREYGTHHFLFMFPGAHLLMLLLWLLIAPAIVVRWRLGKRLAPFRLADRFTIPAFIAVLFMLGIWSLVILSVLEHFGMEKYALIALAGPPVFCLCLIIANSLRAIFDKPSARLAQALTAIAVLPAYPLAIIALCALMPIFSAGEKQWLAKETLLRIDPDAPDLGAYEFKVAVQKRKEINALLGIE